jgi:hypothetical protein
MAKTKAKALPITEPIIDTTVHGVAKVTRPPSPNAPIITPDEYQMNAYMNLLVNAEKTDRRRILISVPMTGLIRAEWAMARWGQMIPTNWSASDCLQYISQVTPLGYDVANARNIAVQIAVTQGFDWLFFIDHDVCIPPDCFMKINAYMRSGDIPVVFGLYFTKSDPPEPLLYRGRGNSYFANFHIGDKVWVDGIGMGETLISVKLLKLMWEDAPEYIAGGNMTVRKVFDTPQMIWYDPETDGRRALGGTEDLAWCDRVVNGDYLRKAGFPKIAKRKHWILADTSMFAWHIREDGVRFPLRFAW